GLIQRVASRWHAWKDAREDDRMRRKLQQTRTSGRKPVNQITGKVVDEQGVPPEPDSTIHLPDETDIFSTTRPKKEKKQNEEEIREREVHKAPIFVLDQKPEKAGVAKKAGDPKIAKGATNYRLPSVSLLREGERSQRLDEDELKMRARAIEEKCLE